MHSVSNFVKWSIWVLAAVFYFYEFALRVSPGVMVDELMASFGITASSFGILSACYLYVYAPMQLPVGMLMDRFGVKKILSIASIVCGAGALLFSMAASLGTACLGRSLIGGGSAFAFVAMVYITSHYFPQKRRAFLIGIANSIAMLGASAGSGPLANFIHAFGWRKPIALLGFFGILLGFAIYLLLQGDKRTKEVEKQTHDHTADVFKKMRSILTHKSTWINALVALFFYMTTTAFAGLWGVSFLQTSYGLSKEVSGYAISMVFLGWLFGGPIIGFISDRAKKRKHTIRLGILGVLLCLIPILYLPSLPVFFIYALLFLLGLFSSAELLSFSLAIELNHPAAKASAAAFTNFLISCGDSLVQPLVGFLLDWNWSGVMENELRVYGAHDYRLALSCLPIALIIAFALLFFVKEKNYSE